MSVDRDDDGEMWSVLFFLSVGAAFSSLVQKNLEMCHVSGQLMSNPDGEYTLIGPLRSDVKPEV